MSGPLQIVLPHFIQPCTYCRVLTHHVTVFTCTTTMYHVWLESIYINYILSYMEVTTVFRLFFSTMRYMLHPFTTIKVRLYPELCIDCCSG